MKEEFFHPGGDHRFFFLVCFLISITSCVFFTRKSGLFPCDLADRNANQGHAISPSVLELHVHNSSPTAATAETDPLNASC